MITQRCPVPGSWQLAVDTRATRHLDARANVHGRIPVYSYYYLASQGHIAGPHHCATRTHVGARCRLQLHESRRQDGIYLTCASGKVFLAWSHVDMVRPGDQKRQSADLRARQYEGYTDIPVPMPVSPMCLSLLSAVLVCPVRACTHVRGRERGPSAGLTVRLFAIATNIHRSRQRY